MSAGTRERGGQRDGLGGVLSQHPCFPGRWVAYEGTNFSGEQYILEKGVYRNCEDWGATDCRIASAQPILQVREPDTPRLCHGTHWCHHARGWWGPGQGKTPTSPAVSASRSGNATSISSPRSGVADGEGNVPPLGDVALCGVVVMLCPPSPSPSAPYPQILLFSEPDFLGDHVAFEEDQDALPTAFVPRSCRVRGGR